MSGSSSSSSSRAPPNAPTGPRRLRYTPNMSFGQQLRPASIHPWSRNPSPSAQRHSSSPLIHSPLQQSFPAEPDMSQSAPNSPKDMATQEAPSRRSRLSKQAGRPRGESRSSSVLIVIRGLKDSGEINEGSGRRSLNSQSGPSSQRVNASTLTKIAVSLPSPTSEA
jgi:hypothetical protein